VWCATMRHRRHRLRLVAVTSPIRTARTTRSAVRSALALASTLALLAAGCSGGGSRDAADKAGGSSAPLELRLAAAFGSADQPEARYAREFATRVGKLSDGRLRVRVIFGAEGAKSPNVETLIARRVRDGSYDLGWIGARAWDELGVTSFQALQTPFLVTNYALLDKVVSGPIAREMLAGLDGHGVVGLALIPGLLRHPFGLRRPLLSPRDFAGARIRVIPSRATDALFRALGATPVHAGSAGLDVRALKIGDGEASFANLPTGAIASANIVLFAKALTIFAGERAFARLTSEQRDILRRAAAATLAGAASYPVRQSIRFEGELVGQWCRLRGRTGYTALATPAELAALARAAQPVVESLQRDAETRHFIAEIRRLSAELPPAPPITAPASCLSSPRNARSSAVSRPPGFLDGTYRWVLTAASARASGQTPGPDLPLVGTAVLRGGTWAFAGEDHDGGTFRAKGDRLVFDWPRIAGRLTFTFRRDRDGTLHLKPVLPMDPGDQFVWSGAPWRRIGPPIDLNP